MEVVDVWEQHQSDHVEEHAAEKRHGEVRQGLREDERVSVRVRLEVDAQDEIDEGCRSHEDMHAKAELDRLLRLGLGEGQVQVRHVRPQTNEVLERAHIPPEEQAKGGEDVKNNK